MQAKVKFFRKNEHTKVPLDTSVLFLTEDGEVCEIVSRGDCSFVTTRWDVSYTIEVER